MNRAQYRSKQTRARQKSGRAGPWAVFAILGSLAFGWMAGVLWAGVADRGTAGIVSSDPFVNNPFNNPNDRRLQAPFKYSKSGEESASATNSGRHFNVAQVALTGSSSDYVTYYHQTYTNTLAPVGIYTPKAVAAPRISVSYAVMVRDPGGFGGVIFGNTVEGQADGGLQRIVWKPGARTNEGVIEITLAGGATAQYGPVCQEDAYAAYQIVFKGIPGQIPPLAQGQGVGLVGLVTGEKDSPVPYFDCSSDGVVHEGRRFKVVMHPALDNTDLGWATLHVDSLPITANSLESLVEKTSGKEKRNELSQILKQTPGTWKIADAPLRMAISQGRLTVSAAEENNRTNYLRFIGFGAGSNPEAQLEDAAAFSERFTEFMPVIIRASHDFDRLNQFAAVLGVFRWAKQEGATYPASLAPKAPPTRGLETPASLIVCPEGLVPAPRYGSKDEILEELRAKIKRQMKVLMSENGSEAAAEFVRIEKDVLSSTNQASAVVRRAMAIKKDLLKAIAELEENDPVLGRKIQAKLLEKELKEAAALLEVEEPGEKAPNEAQGIEEDLKNLLESQPKLADLLEAQTRLQQDLRRYQSVMERAVKYLDSLSQHSDALVKMLERYLMLDVEDSVKEMAQLEE